MFIPACGRRLAAQLGKCPASERALQQAVVSAAGAPAQDFYRSYSNSGGRTLSSRCNDVATNPQKLRKAAWLTLGNCMAFWKKMARVTGLEPATSGVTGRHSNRLSYTRALDLSDREDTMKPDRRRRFAACFEMARVTGLEPATSGVTGRHSNRLSYTRILSSNPVPEHPPRTGWPLG